MSCAPCPLGSYCSGGSSTPCPAGTWGGSRYLTTPDCSGACTAPPGSMCPLGTSSAIGVPCSAGFWCAGGVAQPVPCACPSLCGTGQASDPYPLPTWSMGGAVVAGRPATNAFSDGMGTNAAFYNVRQISFSAGSGVLTAADDRNHRSAWPVEMHMLHTHALRFVDSMPHTSPLTQTPHTHSQSASLR